MSFLNKYFSFFLSIDMSKIIVMLIEEKQNVYFKVEDNIKIICFGEVLSCKRI